MTPLAHEIVKDSLRPIRERQHGDAMKALQLLDDVHFFECTEVATVAADLGNGLAQKGFSEKLAFLPAPRTWLEFMAPEVGRCAFLLEEANNNWASVRLVSHVLKSGGRAAQPQLWLPMRGSADLGTWHPGEHLKEMPNWSEYGKIPTLIYGLLAMINTPRVIMRRQHMPHRGLERRLVAQRGNIAKWPLQGWSELLLKVQPPDIAEGEHEAHLTGARALHFCRAHLRIRLGKLELVSAHWRGDAALGIKQTRYRLAA